MLDSVGIRSSIKQILMECMSQAEACSGIVLLFHESSDTLEVATVSGFSEEHMKQWDRIPLVSENFLATAARTNTPGFITPAINDNSDPLLLATQSYAALPLFVEDQLSGVVGFAFDRTDFIPEQESKFLTAIARQCALGIDRVCLKAELKRANDEIYFLDGLEFNQKAFAAPMTLGNNSIPSLSGRDASQQTRSENARQTVINALHLAEQRYRSLIQATSCIAWIADNEGNMVLPQHQWCSFTGQTEEELRDFGTIFAVHPEDRHYTIQKWQQAIRLGRLHEIEHRLRRSDGEYRLMAVRAVPVRGDDGKIREWIGVHTDITEERLAEQRQHQFVHDVLNSVTEGRLHLCASEEDLPNPLRSESDADMYAPLSLAPNMLAELRYRIRTLAAKHGFAEDRAMGLMSAASECAMNAITHGAHATVQILDSMDGSMIQIQVTDKGMGIDMAELPKATLMRGYSSPTGAGGFGHGFFLMLAYVDAIYLRTSTQGTTVVLEQWRTPPPESFGF